MAVSSKSMFQDLSRRPIETSFRGFKTRLKLIKTGKVIKLGEQ